MHDQSHTWNPLIPLSPALGDAISLDLRFSLGFGYGFLGIDCFTRSPEGAARAHKMHMETHMLTEGARDPQDATQGTRVTPKTSKMHPKWNPGGAKRELSS